MYTVKYTKIEKDQNGIVTVAVIDPCVEGVESKVGVEDTSLNRVTAKEIENLLLDDCYIISVQKEMISGDGSMGYTIFWGIEN